MAMDSYKSCELVVQLLHSSRGDGEGDVKGHSSLKEGPCYDRQDVVQDAQQAILSGDVNTSVSVGGTPGVTSSAASAIVMQHHGLAKGSTPAFTPRCSRGRPNAIAAAEEAGPTRSLCSPSLSQIACIGAAAGTANGFPFVPQTTAAMVPKVQKYRGIQSA
jgi:hypothetical protein